MKRFTAFVIILMVTYAAQAQGIVGDIASTSNKKSTIVFPERERIKTKAQLAKEQAEQQKTQEITFLKENYTYKANEVDTKPSFLEGDAALDAYITKTLKSDIPLQHSAPNGVYSIIVTFVVNKDGSVGGIKPLTSFGYGMEKEAIRVVSKTNNLWKSATINNKAVHCEKQIVISFSINNE
jgi:hypothetical protein